MALVTTPSTTASTSPLDVPAHARSPPSTQTTTSGESTQIIMDSTTVATGDKRSSTPPPSLLNSEPAAPSSDVKKRGEKFESWSPGATGSHVVAGESLISTKPCFSRDSKYLFICCGQVVRILVNATGATLRDLKGHTKPVTSVCLDPRNRFQLYSSSLDNSILLWDYEDGLLLKRIEVDTSLIGSDFYSVSIYGIYFFRVEQERANCGQEFHLLVSRRDSKELQLLVSRRDNKELQGDKNLYLVRGVHPKPTATHIECSSIVMGKCNPKTAGESLDPLLIDSGCDGRIVVAVNAFKRKTLHVYDAKANLHYQHHNRHDSMECLSCHPHLPLVIVGCHNGKILVMSDIDTQRVTRVVYHWHSLSVTGVAFTRDGTHFLSGGHECVLVRWNLEASADRQYIPRLGAAISKIAISPNNDFYSVSLSDNSVNIFASTRLLQQVFQGMVRCPFRRAVVGDSKPEVALPAALRSSAVPTGLHLDPKSGYLVLNGRLGHLQFFDIAQNRHLYSMDILDLNYVSPDSLDEEQVLAEVKLIAFDANGDWLVTVEQWKTVEISQQLRIKVWKQDSLSKKFELNTVINKPHSGEVTQIAFRGYSEFYSPEYAMFATSSLDGKCKFWCYEEEDNDDDDGTDGNQSYWANDAVATFQNQIPNDLDFSEDGSVVGIAFGKYLTLWTTEACELKDSHTNPDKTDTSSIRKVVFGRYEACHFVVYATAKAIVVYDVLTLAVAWFEDICVSQLVRDPVSSHMAAFESAQRRTSVFVFRPNSKSLVDFLTLETDCVQPTSAIFLPRAMTPMTRSALASLPAWRRKSRLLFLNQSQQLKQIGSEGYEEEVEEQRREGEDGEGSIDVGTGVRVKKLERKTLFGSLMMAEESRTDVSEPQVDFSSSAIGRPTRAFVDGPLAMPAHVLPPVETLCKQMHAMILRKVDHEGGGGGSKESRRNETEMTISKHAIGDEEKADEKVKKEESENWRCWDDVLAKLPVRDFSWLRQSPRP